MSYHIAIKMVPPIWVDEVIVRPLDSQGGLSHDMMFDRIGEWGWPWPFIADPATGAGNGYGTFTQYMMSGMPYPYDDVQTEGNTFTINT